MSPVNLGRLFLYRNLAVAFQGHGAPATACGVAVNLVTACSVQPPPLKRSVSAHSPPLAGTTEAQYPSDKQPELIPLQPEIHVTDSLISLSPFCSPLLSCINCGFLKIPCGLRSICHNALLSRVIRPEHLSVLCRLPLQFFFF